jgi:hypothetical protein
MTIFGFNTDVKLGDVVYHVQSEARQNDLLLQTMVFVKGACVGKHAVSYAHMSMQQGFSEGAMHELLKAQHKAALDMVQQGQMAEFSGGTEVQDVGGIGLALKWTRISPENLGASLLFHVQVSDGRAPVNSARVAAFPCSPQDAEALSHATTDAEGNVALPVALTEDVERDLAVMIQATSGGKSATRKFRFRK